MDFNEFLEMMTQPTRSAPGRAQEHEMRQAFNVFDIDGNGFIDQHELRVTIRNLGENPSDRDIRDMIGAADVKGDGRIDYEGTWKKKCNRKTLKNVYKKFIKIFLLNQDLRMFDLFVMCIGNDNTSI